MTCCGGTDIDTLPNAPLSPGEAMEKELLASSHELENGLIQTDFLVPGMHCIACIRTLEKSIGELSFVERVRANLSLKKVSVTWNRQKGSILDIEQSINATGFDHTVYDLNSIDSEKQTDGSKSLLLALAVAGFAAMNIMLLSVSVWSGADEETARLFHLISGIIAVPAVMYSGQPFFRSALKALRAGRLNMDVPISLAVILALAMSIFESLSGGKEAYFDAAVTLLFFLLIGRYLDNLMRDKARSAVVQLSRLAAKGAMVVGDDGGLTYVRLDDIRPGMKVRIRAGERVPVDGEIVSGQSDVDRSLVTGESIPQPVAKGAYIEAGILNMTGVVDIMVKQDARHSFLGEVRSMMEAAEQGRGYYTGIADRLAAIYAPAVHLIALIAFVGWMIVTRGDWHTSMYVAISVLIITCPCALGLAVPVVHVVAARRLFREGILIREGSGFERLEEVDHIVFDKTGTLTDGQPIIQNTPRLRQFLNTEHAAIVKTLAGHSTHPLSRAIDRVISGDGADGATQIREVPGAGIEARFGSRLARLGHQEWVAELLDADQSETSGHDGLSFAIEGEPLMQFEYTEELRQGSVASIAILHNQNIAQEMLSGDGRNQVSKIADELHLDNFQYDLKPADKISRIEHLKQQGRKVLMVGDGLNDSPALAAAHVSIAPASASDIARQAADFVFTRASLGAVPFAMHIAGRTGNLVKTNFALAILYNMVAIPFAMAGYVTPLIAAIAMSASSIVVVLNSMRLNYDTPSQRKFIESCALAEGQNQILKPQQDQVFTDHKERFA